MSYTATLVKFRTLEWTMAYMFLVGRHWFIMLKIIYWISLRIGLFNPFAPHFQMDILLHCRQSGYVACRRRQNGVNSIHVQLIEWVSNDLNQQRRALARTSNDRDKTLTTINVGRTRKSRGNGQLSLHTETSPQSLSRAALCFRATFATVVVVFYVIVVTSLDSQSQS